MSARSDNPGSTAVELDKIDVDNLDWGTFRDWCELVRLPNVFTLFSDCIAAVVVAGSFLLPLTALLPTLLASLCAYWAGMILNDVVDIEQDRVTRPNRPLASNRISPTIAGHVATGLLMIVPIIILGITTLHTSQPLWMGAAFFSAVLLSLCVRSYDSVLKATPIGPVLMGLCRSLNIMMVGCTMFSLGSAEVLPQSLAYFAGGIGLYITGVTVYARREERDSSAVGLFFGLMLEAAGLVVIGCLPRWAPEPTTWTLVPDRGYLLLVGLIGVTILNRGFAGVMHPVSRKVQLAVKHAILSLILIDAAVVLMWAGPWYGCAVVLLLLPALTSAIRFRST